MENRRNRTSEELAETRKELFGFGSSSRAAQTASGDPNGVTVEPPDVKIEFENGVSEFMPADFLICEYIVDLLPAHKIHAIETSVVWMTEGKGDTDIGVHFFERRQRQTITNETFKLKQRLGTVLPASPLSYKGKVLSVRWCVRVRIFLAEGSQSTTDEYFRLGVVDSHSQIAMDNSDSSESSDKNVSGESGIQ